MADLPSQHRTRAPRATPARPACHPPPGSRAFCLWADCTHTAPTWLHTASSFKPPSGPEVNQTLPVPVPNSHVGESDGTAGASGAVSGAGQGGGTQSR